MLITLSLRESFSELLSYSIGLVLPIYYTFKALNNEDVGEEENIRAREKWLRYWMVFGSFLVFQVITNFFFSWFPFYYELKIIISILIVTPKINTLIYHLLSFYLVPFESSIDETIDEQLHMIYDLVVTKFGYPGQIKQKQEPEREPESEPESEPEQDQEPEKKQESEQELDKKIKPKARQRPRVIKKKSSEQEPEKKGKSPKARKIVKKRSTTPVKTRLRTKKTVTSKTPTRNNSATRKKLLQPKSKTEPKKKSLSVEISHQVSKKENKKLKLQV